MMHLLQQLQLVIDNVTMSMVYQMTQQTMDVPVLMVNSTGDDVAEDQAEDIGNSGSSNEDLMPAPLTALHQTEYEQWMMKNC